jgi:hypothetical protein
VTWAAVRAFFGGVFGFLRLIPWQVWLAAAVLVAAWWWGERRHDEGVAEERLAWTDAQRKENLEVAVDRAVRAAFADVINAKASRDAQAVQHTTRDETLAALGRIENAIADFFVPIGCPVNPPERVRAEGRAAVERARAAGRAMRAGSDTGGAGKGHDAGSAGVAR